MGNYFHGGKSFLIRRAAFSFQRGEARGGGKQCRSQVDDEMRVFIAFELTLQHFFFLPSLKTSRQQEAKCTNMFHPPRHKGLVSFHDSMHTQTTAMINFFCSKIDCKVWSEEKSGLGCNCIAKKLLPFIETKAVIQLTGFGNLVQLSNKELKKLLKSIETLKLALHVVEYILNWISMLFTLVLLWEVQPNCHPTLFPSRLNFSYENLDKLPPRAPGGVNQMTNQSLITHD